MIGKAVALALVALSAAAVGGASPAESAFPGANGRIVFQRGAAYEGGSSNLFLVREDGNGLVQTHEGVPARCPAVVVAGRLAHRVRVHPPR